MKLFIYEHITSGALINESLPASLAREGNDMLTAIVHDMTALTDIELIILRDTRLAAHSDIINTPRHHCYIITNDHDFQHAYANALNEADAVFIIAPETDGLLQKMQQSVLDKAVTLLGCHPSATKICSDKYHCHQQLISQNLTTPHTILASTWSDLHFTSPTGFIVKPRDGAGCIDTLFFVDVATLETWLTSATLDLSQIIIQTYIEGESISLTVLLDHRDCQVLAINQQHIKIDHGQLSFHGCCVNGITDSHFSLSQATNIVDRIHHAITGLWGFIGIDLIITHNDVYIIDINPRLTTSYVGLHQSLSINPAQLLLTMMEQGLAAHPTISQRNAIEILV